MELIRTHGYKAFKKKVGQDNHFLITILIELDGVKNGVVTKEDGFKTTWNPPSVEVSALRSRDFAIKGALAWLVDNLDSYFMSTYSKPKLIQNPDFESSYCSANQSVFLRYKVFSDHIINLPSVEMAFVDLAINWRNRLVHSKANNPILKVSNDVLLSESDYISKNYQGLETRETLNNFLKKETPKFKEITAIIRACMTFIEKLDWQLVQKLDKKKYVKDVVSYYIHEVIQMEINRVWGKSFETRKRQLTNILRSFSFTETKEQNEIDLYIEEIASYSETSVREVFKY